MKNHPSGDDRLQLWVHLVSEHAGIFSATLSYDELLEIHSDEHNGPCGIRNHPENSRKFGYQKLGKVLSEAEPEDETRT